MFADGPGPAGSPPLVAAAAAAAARAATLEAAAPYIFSIAWCCSRWCHTTKYLACRLSSRRLTCKGCAQLQYNELAFRAFVAAVVKLRVSVVSRETTLHAPHGATTLELGPYYSQKIVLRMPSERSHTYMGMTFSLESGCFGDRHNRDGRVRARVCARG